MFSATTRRSALLLARSPSHPTCTRILTSAYLHTSPTLEDPSPPSKKGRPRTRPLVVVDPSAPKRGPGRPRKPAQASAAPPPTSTNETPPLIEVIEPLTNVPNLVKPTRPRKSDDLTKTGKEKKPKANPVSAVSSPVAPSPPPPDAPGMYPEVDLDLPTSFRRAVPGVLDKEVGEMELPEHLFWREHFTATGPVIRDRVTVSNPETARLLAERFVPEGSEGKVIVEAYPGPGALTRALLDLPKNRIRRLIIIENHEPYLAYLRPLAAADPRVQIIEKSGWFWSSYENLGDEQHLLGDVPRIPWDQGVHPSLQFISHLPLDIHGEQLMSQILRSIPDQQWLFQYGRVPMNFILSDWVWQRMEALAASHICKLTIISRAVASSRLIVPHRVLTPYNAHFHPLATASASSANSWGWGGGVGPGEVMSAEDAAATMRNRKAGYPFQALGVVPLPRPDNGDGNEMVQMGPFEEGTMLIGKRMLDKWDYVLRKLFVLKASKLRKALPSLAPGAAVLIKRLDGPDVAPDERVDTTKMIRELTLRDWYYVMKVFDRWPFAPEDLLVTDGLSRDRHNRNSERNS